ncbi:MAG: hypothetical protein ACREV1_09805 [Gammaproteobacteria bacterium]
MAKKHLTVGDIVEGVLAVNELNRLRELELKQELAPPVARSEGDPKEHLKKWNRIILSDSLERDSAPPGEPRTGELRP